MPATNFLIGVLGGVIAQGAGPRAIMQVLEPTLRAWSDNEDLRAPLLPLVRLIPTTNAELTSEDVTNALQAANANLNQAPDEAVRAMLEDLRRQFDQIVQNRQPAIGGLFRRLPETACSNDVDDLENVSALRPLVLAATHDANNALCPLKAETEIALMDIRGIIELNESSGRHQQVAKLLAFEHQIDDVVAQLDELTLKIDRLKKLAAHPGNRAEFAHLFHDGSEIERMDAELRKLLESIRALEEAAENCLRMNLAGGGDLIANMAEGFEPLPELVDRIIDFFRPLRTIAAEFKEESFQRIDLNEHIHPKIIRALMGRNIRVDIDLEPATAPILGSSASLWQIIQNLAVNAQHAMRGSGGLSIATKRVSVHDNYFASLDADLIRLTPGSGEYMMLRVGDTGSGIPNAILGRIFDLNFSGKGSSGQGLSDSEKAVAAMGGFITVKTSTVEPSGTIFSVYFPLAADDSDR